MRSLHSILNIFFVANVLLFFSCEMNKNVDVNILQETSADCPPEGSAKSERIANLNRLKNRLTFPQAKDFDTTITLKKILTPGNDEARWNVLKAAKITGYVYDVKPGGIETCNCKEKEIGDRDTHIELVIDPMSNGKIQRVIVEVTPRIRELMKSKGENWNTKKLRDDLLGRWVTFEGWLLFDEEHANQAENTNPGRERNWRATAWEVHPVTNFKITTKPR
jgi:hypothetical protein